MVDSKARLARLKVGINASFLAVRVLVALIHGVPSAIGLWLYGGDDYFLRKHLGATMRRGCLRLGPFFVKLGQAASCRRDFLPTVICDELALLFDSVHYKTDLAQSLLPSTEELALLGVVNADHSPIGSGSIAAVFAGVMAGGDHVAIKVVRTWVLASVRRDAMTVRSILKSLERYSKLKHLPLSETFERLTPIILNQVDMERESDALRRFADNLDPRDRVRLPKVFSNNRGVLVMEFIEDALPINSDKITDTQFQQAAIRLLRALYRMIFISGFVYCDFHPGNILVSKNGEVILLDGGLAAQLTNDDRITFRSFFLSIVYGDVGACAGAILRSAIYRPARFDHAKFRVDVNRLVQLYHKKRAGDFLVGALVNDIFDLQRAHGLYGSPGFVSAVWALAMFEGIVRPRYPALDFQSEARPYMVSAIIEDVALVVG